MVPANNVGSWLTSAMCFLKARRPMMVDFPDPLCPTKAVDFPASIVIEKPLKTKILGLAGYAKSTSQISTRPVTFSGLCPLVSSGSISEYRSKTAKTDPTESPPLARSLVIVPASAMTRPVLTKIRNVCSKAFIPITPSATSFPPYQKSKAQVHVMSPLDVPSPIPANHDWRMLSRFGPSWAFFSIWRILAWEENAVTVRRLATASAAKLLLSSWALLAFFDMLFSKTHLQ
nr:hypothetical protein CDL15_Pgr005792 [Ipomoea trifida]